MTDVIGDELPSSPPLTFVYKLKTEYYVKLLDIAPAFPPTNLNLFARIWHACAPTRHTLTWVCLVGKIAILEGSNPPQCATFLTFSE